MSDEGSRDNATRRPARGEHDSNPAFDLSALFAKGRDGAPGLDEFAAEPFRDDVGALFAEPHAPRPLPRAAVPARWVREEEAPSTHGLTRPQLVAMGVGAVVTLLGVGWALTVPSGSGLPGPSPSPSVSADPARAAQLGGAIQDLAAAQQAAQASAESFVAPLAAMAGSSDETARTAAEGARQAYAEAVAAVTVPTAPTASADPATLDRDESAAASAHAALTAATDAFHAAISAFTQSLPAYAAVAVSNNSSAAESFHSAVTEAAAAVATSDPFGPSAFASWDAWHGALAALIADEARALAESRSSDFGSTSQSEEPVATESFADPGLTDSGATDADAVTEPPPAG